MTGGYGGGTMGRGGTVKELLRNRKTKPDREKDEALKRAAEASDSFGSG